jgi:hypothetical protein
MTSSNKRDCVFAQSDDANHALHVTRNVHLRFPTLVVIDAGMASADTVSRIDL